MRHSPHVGPLSAALLAGLLAWAGGAVAADTPAVPARSASAPMRSASAPARGASAAARRSAAASRGAASAAARAPLLLSASQAKECLSQEQALRAATDDAAKDKAALAAERSAVEASQQALADQLPTLNRADAQQVDAYNAKVAERGTQVDAYQAKVVAFNAKVDALNASKSTYAASCANQRYDADQLSPGSKKARK